jgi:hypothetical protein
MPAKISNEMLNVIMNFLCQQPWLKVKDLIPQIQADLAKHNKPELPPAPPVAPPAPKGLALTRE